MRRGDWSYARGALPRSRHNPLHPRPTTPPAVPRHNLHLVRSALEPLCKKHNIPYRSTTLWAGTVEILSHLKAVAKELANGPM